MRAEMVAGLGRNKAAAIVSEHSGWRKRDIYKLSVKDWTEEN
jgi:hypothetical protein